MTCPACGAQNADQARFCLSCGAVPGVPRQIPKWLPFLAGGAILLVLALGLNAAGILTLPGFAGQRDGLQALGGRDGTDVALPGDGGRPEITVTGEAPDPNVQATAQRMPDDVRRWLEHLKRVDTERKSLNTRLVGEMMATANSLGPGMFVDEDQLRTEDQRRLAEAGSAMGRVDTYFVALINDFQSLPPPAECRPIAAEYNELLLGSRQMISEIFQAMNSLDASTLYSKMGTSYQRVDARGKSANRLIDDICSKYREPNRYAVFVDRPGGMGMPGGMAGPGMAEYERLLRQLMEEEDG